MLAAWQGDMSQGNLLFIITGLVWTLFLISSGKLWAACAATATEVATVRQIFGQLGVKVNGSLPLSEYPGEIVRLSCPLDYSR
jgi:hypothetical protein